MSSIGHLGRFEAAVGSMSDSILLVEDEHALRVTLGDRLRKEGYLVDCAADAEEAVGKTTRLPFDLFIRDVMLPGRDGLTCAGHPSGRPVSSRPS